MTRAPMTETRRRSLLIISIWLWQNIRSDYHVVFHNGQAFHRVGHGFAPLVDGCTEPGGKPFCFLVSRDGHDAPPTVRSDKSRPVVSPGGSGRLLSSS